MYYAVTSSGYFGMQVIVSKSFDSGNIKTIADEINQTEVVEVCKRLEKKGYKFGHYKQDRNLTTEKPEFLM
jgi:hypothetical protein